jgi:hypothetical protein
VLYRRARSLQQRQPEISLAGKLLGWTPRGLKDGLMSTVAYFERLLSDPNLRAQLAKETAARASEYQTDADFVARNGRPFRHICEQLFSIALANFRHHVRFALAPAFRPADGHCGLLSESMRPLGSGKAIRCPTEWRSRRGPVMVRAIADGGRASPETVPRVFWICCGQRVLGRHLPLRPKSPPLFDYPTNLNPTAAKW